MLYASGQHLHCYVSISVGYSSLPFVLVQKHKTHAVFFYSYSSEGIRCSRQIALAVVMRMTVSVQTAMLLL